MYILILFSGAGFRSRFFVLYAYGVKISGAENKRITVILYPVSAMHCSGQIKKIYTYICTNYVYYVLLRDVAFWLVFCRNIEANDGRPSWSGECAFLSVGYGSYAQEKILKFYMHICSFCVFGRRFG